MRSLPVSTLKKIKKRRILVISAGGLKGGLQCLYCTINGDSWEIIAHAFIPYPQKMATLLDRIADTPAMEHSFAELAWLDYRLSLLFTECAKTTLAKLPSALRKPHLAVVNKPDLWKGPTGEDLQQQQWDLPFGDAQHLAASFDIPVLTDLVRHRCLAGGQAALPTHYGNIRLASSIGGTVIFINIGLVTRMTIVATKKPEIMIDSDTGPGTCIINAAMRAITRGTDREAIDRDGTLASQGTVHGECLQRLSNDEWFRKPSPKQARPEQFDTLLDDPELAALSDADRLATITALTARTIYNFYRAEYKKSDEATTVVLSGGGTNNLTLTGYLSTYFDHIPVENIDRFGIPPDMRIPLALTLSVNAYLSGIALPWETGNNPVVSPMGKWILP